MGEVVVHRRLEVVGEQTVPGAGTKVRRTY